MKYNEIRYKIFSKYHYSDKNKTIMVYLCS